MLSAKSSDHLYTLHTGIIGKGPNRHERPHKPCMLLAILDMIASGQATQERIEWSDPLIARFSAYFKVVQTNQDKETPENPFYYLNTEGFWKPQRVTMSGAIEPLYKPPLRRDAKTGNVFASIDTGLANLLDPIERETIREILVSRYFPLKAPFLKALFQDFSDGKAMQIGEADQECYPGRSASFRKIVVQIYDYQCAACGLRINIRSRNIIFVDAAHLIPFKESFNDHPSNGLALCKNHHWAMDQNLIAPTTKGYWSVSKILDKRRSLGESHLIDLEGKQILSPKEEAFAPSQSSLQWRHDKLLA